MHQMVGSCQCENIEFKIRLSQSLSCYQPRACDCTFCEKHGAAYLSDPEGSLHLKAREPSQISKHRQGSGSAEFLICAKCSALVAVTFAEGDQIFAAVNSKCLKDQDTLQEASKVSPQFLSKAEKIQRWKTVWFSDVKIDFP